MNIKRTASLWRGSCRGLAVIRSNVPCAAQQLLHGQLVEYDTEVDKYNNSVSALLYRRWTKKEEVPP